MANTVVEQNTNVGALQKERRTWVLGLLVCAVASVAVGLWLAAITAQSPALPWVGTAFVLAMGLALVVGASKTSSA